MNWIYNKNVIITGASSGIGKELTKVLITKYNCCVLGIARNKEKLENLKNELSEFGDKFNFYSMDVSVCDNWELFAQYLDRNKFCPDILINNAGTMPPFESFANVSNEKIEQVFKTNFFSATYAIKNLLPVLLKSKTPAIINVASAASLCALPGTSVYSASKSALKTYSEILHSELRKKVYVCTVMPGFVKTNLFYSNDNKKNVFAERDKKFVNKFCMDLTKATKKIVKAIKRKKARLIVGFDAKIINFLYKLMPQTSGNMLGGILKKTKMESFEDIFLD